MKTSVISTATLAIALLASSRAPADLSADQARDILNKVAPAVVSVRTATKTTMAMEGRQADKIDQESESTGCVVSPDGLTAVSLTGIDPYSSYGDMFASMGDDFRVDVQSEISDIKLRFNNGTEVPAEVVIRDKDLDIAFVRPKKKLAAPVPFVDLSASGDAEILDSTLVVTRFGKQNRWETMASVARIRAVFTKPRRMFLLQEMGDRAQESLGSLAMSQEGKTLGVILLRRLPAMGKNRPNAFLIVLPAKDVMTVAKQVEPSASSTGMSPGQKSTAKPATASKN
ncbi:MAG: trypsin-like peptidase domain-containing protein [Armatimonadetes bacterium]|nr:trypsin-like peptidase domain-containing protein [Armatimonadota bacterium]